MKRFIKLLLGEIFYYIAIAISKLGLCRIRQCDLVSIKSSLIAFGYVFQDYDVPSMPGIICDCDLSIIIPVYNVEKYLRKCLISILRSPSKYSYEIICINDGSSDNSLSILNDFANKHPEVRVISQNNMGLASARNVGIINARGKYISFVDSDDYVENGYVNSILDIITSSQADILQVNYYTQIENSKYRDIGQQKINAVFQIDDIFKYQTFLHGFACMACFKKSIFETVWFKQGSLFEDNIILPFVLPFAKIVAITDKPLYTYLIRPSSLCHSLCDNNIKTLDQCWNLISIANSLIEQQNYHFTGWSFSRILYELSVMFDQRTKGLRISIRYKAFKMISYYVQKWKVQINVDDAFLSMVNVAFRDCNFLLFELLVTSNRWKLSNRH